MKRKIFTVCLSCVFVLLLLTGCGSKSDGLINGKSYSTANGDKVPVDIGNVTLSYSLQQSDISSFNDVTVTAELTNNTNVAFTDSYYIFFVCVDGSSGAFGYSGDIQPGQTVSMNGLFAPKTTGYVYKTDDLKFKSILTGFNPNDKQHCAINYNLESSVYEWDFSEIK